MKTTINHIKFLELQIGNIFEFIKPYCGLWKSRGNVIYIKFNRYNIGHSDWLEKLSFIKTVEEAGGGNVLKVTFNH